MPRHMLPKLAASGLFSIWLAARLKCLAGDSQLGWGALWNHLARLLEARSPAHSDLLHGNSQSPPLMLAAWQQTWRTWQTIRFLYLWYTSSHCSRLPVVYPLEEVIFFSVQSLYLHRRKPMTERAHPPATPQPSPTAQLLKLERVGNSQKQTSRQTSKLAYWHTGEQTNKQKG